MEWTTYSSQRYAFRILSSIDLPSPSNIAQQAEELEAVRDKLQEKQSVIKNKEKAIKELKNYNDHLEKFKFVLNHKIKTLKDEKSPMEEQVQTLEAHIRNMYNELAEETS